MKHCRATLYYLFQKTKTKNTFNQETFCYVSLQKHTPKKKKVSQHTLGPEPEQRHDNNATCHWSTCCEKRGSRLGWSAETVREEVEDMPLAVGTLCMRLSRDAEQDQKTPRGGSRLSWSGRISREQQLTSRLEKERSYKASIELKLSSISFIYHNGSEFTQSMMTKFSLVFGP